MAVFAIAFRIHEDADYDERWSSVVDAIRKQTSSQFWNETAAFALIESSKSSQGILGGIETSSKFDASLDMLLVINLNQADYAKAGPFADRNLDDIMAKRRGSIA